MPRNKALPLRLLGRAAELRAGGASWDAVADHLGRSAETVRKWPALYPAVWAKLLRAAERQQVREAAAESIHTLRLLLRSDDEKVKRDAAQKLVQLRVALGRRRKPAAKPAPPSDLMRTAAYLETLTDEQRNQLLDEFVAEQTQHRGDQPPLPLPPGP